MLYAADFKQRRKVDVYNGAWALQTLPAGAFTDPSLPADYAPFGIQTIGTRIFVTYAKQSRAADDEFPGAGQGLRRTRSTPRATCSAASRPPAC